MNQHSPPNSYPVQLYMLQYKYYVVLFSLVILLWDRQLKKNAKTSLQNAKTSLQNISSFFEKCACVLISVASY